MPHQTHPKEFLFVAIHNRTKATQLVRVTNSASVMDATARARAHVSELGADWTLGILGGGAVLNAQNDFVRIHCDPLGTREHLAPFMDARAF